MSARVCLRCGTVAEPAVHKVGSAFVEIILWLFGVVPGLVYGSWRRSRRQSVCGACGSAEIIGLETPIARRMIEEGTIARPAPPTHPLMRAAGRLVGKFTRPRAVNENPPAPPGVRPIR